MGNEFSDRYTLCQMTGMSSDYQSSEVNGMSAAP